jgi:hypothetical protein
MAKRTAIENPSEDLAPAIKCGAAVWVPREFVETQMATLNAGEMKVYLWICAAIPAPDPKLGIRAKAELDITEIARATGLTREWTNKSITGLVSKKLVVRAKRLAGSDPVGEVPVPAEKPSFPDEPAQLALRSLPRPEDPIADAARDVFAGIVSDAPAAARNERLRHSAGQDQAPAALPADPGARLAPPDLRPETGVLLALAQPVQIPIVDQRAERLAAANAEPIAASPSEPVSVEVGFVAQLNPSDPEEAARLLARTTQPRPADFGTPTPLATTQETSPAHNHPPVSSSDVFGDFFESDAQAMKASETKPTRARSPEENPIPMPLIIPGSSDVSNPDSGEEPQMTDDGPEPPPVRLEGQRTGRQENKSQHAETAVDRSEPPPTPGQAEPNPPATEEPARPSPPQQLISIPIQPSRTTVSASPAPAPTGGEKKVIAPMPTPEKTPPERADVSIKRPLRRPLATSFIARSSSFALAKAMAKEIRNLASRIAGRSADSEMILALEDNADNNMESLRAVLEEMDKKQISYDPECTAMFLDEVRWQCQARASRR